MHRIDIWLCGDKGRRDDRLDDLMRALREAHVRVQLCPTAEGATTPENALLWQELNDAHERVRALATGAFDVIGPWMDGGEALVRSLRHARATQSGTPAGTTHLRLGELEIDLIEREAWRQGRTLGLLRREFELLNFLASRPGCPQSRETLLRAIWRLGFDPGTNVVEVHVSRLRAKLDRGFDWPMLRTIKGAGYTLINGAAGEAIVT